MAISIVLGRTPVPVGGGTPIECYIGSLTSNVMVKWSVVGLDDSQVEIAAHGSLANATNRNKTDKDGRVFNYYIAPTTNPPTGYGDRIKAEISTE